MVMGGGSDTRRMRGWTTGLAVVGYCPGVDDVISSSRGRWLWLVVVH